MMTQVTNQDIKEIGGHPITGIMNPGTFCYAISFLQCIRHADAIRIYFLTNRSERIFERYNQRGDSNVERSKLAYQMMTFLNQMWTNKFTTMNVEPLKKALAEFGASKERGSHFAAIASQSGQHDSMEFLDLFLEVMHEVFNAMDDTPENYIRFLFGGKNDYDFIDFDKTLNSSIFSELFMFYRTQHKYCLTCRKVSGIQTVFRSFSFISSTVGER